MNERERAQVIFHRYGHSVTVTEAWLDKDERGEFKWVMRCKLEEYRI